MNEARERTPGGPRRMRPFMGGGGFGYDGAGGFGGFGSSSQRHRVGKEGGSHRGLCAKKRRL